MQKRSPVRSAPPPTSGAPGVGAAPDRQPRGNAAAAEALESRRASLPHFDAVQRAFGHHDVSGIRVVMGGDAKETGARAYADGETVTFATAPDLRTVAHEAAHVVQQRGGVREATDGLEAQADRVADLVVAGKSAEAELDGVGADREAPKGKVRQNLPEKEVSSGAMRRLELAKAAIDHTKEVLSFGAGNQYDALQATNFNSYFRMKAMRDPECWILAPSVRKLASQHPDALTAAKADLAKGGNCGEHAQLGFDYLRATAVGETINRCDVKGLDHAFVILGDVKKEGGSALTVCDPWPTDPTACLWEDHFAYRPDKKEINTRRSVKGDGKDVKSVIAAGLKLSPKGEQMVQFAFTPERSEEELKKGTSRENGAHPWIWRHADTAREKYDYKEQGAE
ncbi:MAG: DUF4157 domain-containing protein [Myxococcota bacterium]